MIDEVKLKNKSISPCYEFLVQLLSLTVFLSPEASGKELSG